LRPIEAWKAALKAECESLTTVSGAVEKVSVEELKTNQDFRGAPNSCQQSKLPKADGKQELRSAGI
jgi:hypothetical protein